MLAGALGGMKTKQLGWVSDRQLWSHLLLHGHVWREGHSWEDEAARAEAPAAGEAWPREKQKAWAGSPWAQADPTPDQLWAHKAQGSWASPKMKGRPASCCSFYQLIADSWCPSSPPLTETETVQTLQNPEHKRDVVSRHRPQRRAENLLPPSTNTASLLNKVVRTEDHSLDAPSLQVFKARLDGAQSNLV